MNSGAVGSALPQYTVVGEPSVNPSAKAFVLVPNRAEHSQSTPCALLRPSGSMFTSMAAQMSHSISIFSLYQVLSRLSILILIVLLQARLRRTPQSVAHDASIMRVGMLRGLSRLRGGVCSARSTPYSHCARRVLWLAAVFGRCSLRTASTPLCQRRVPLVFPPQHAPMVSARALVRACSDDPVRLSSTLCSLLR